jgi:predicted phosphodiesterase
MAQTQLPIRLLQISDMHIDDNLYSPGRRFLDANVQGYIKAFPWWGKGLLGHHGAGINALANFYGLDFRGTDRETFVTGDFTRNGATKQLQEARNFLNSRPGGNSIRFNVCGNHDHWAGINWPLGNPAINISGEFNLPKVISVPLAGQWPPLQFILINTDAEVPPISVRRFLARGEFKEELKRAEAELKKTAQQGIRILLLHHPWLHKGKTCGMTSASRSALGKFVVENSVRVLLSGHIHEARMRTDFATHDGKRQDFLEVCCGATTQLDMIPTRWPRSWGLTLEPNSLVVHQISESNGELRWHAQIYWRGANGFEKSNATVDECSIRIWPI